MRKIPQNTIGVMAMGKIGNNRAEKIIIHNLKTNERLVVFENGRKIKPRKVELKDKLN